LATEEFRVIYPSTFPLLFFVVIVVVVLGCAYKIKLEIMHIDKILLEILMKMKM